MRVEQKKLLLEESLERVVEQIGDITQPTMERYYFRLPAAREAFERLWPGNRSQLEGEMVERALYCLMYWFDSPGEIEIMLGGSVLHHNDTLRVPPEWYAGLIDATIDVIVATIPPANGAELEVWDELRRELGGLVEHSRQFL
jgi:hypothetical protein